MKNNDKQWNNETMKNNEKQWIINNKKQWNFGCGLEPG